MRPHCVKFSFGNVLLRKKMGDNFVGVGRSAKNICMWRVQCDETKGGKGGGWFLKLARQFCRKMDCKGEDNGSVRTTECRNRNNVVRWNVCQWLASWQMDVICWSRILFFNFLCIISVTKCSLVKVNLSWF